MPEHFRVLFNFTASTAPPNAFVIVPIELSFFRIARTCEIFFPSKSSVSKPRKCQTTTLKRARERERETRRRRISVLSSKVVVLPPLCAHLRIPFPKSESLKYASSRGQRRRGFDYNRLGGERYLHSIRAFHSFLGKWRWRRAHNELGVPLYSSALDEGYILYAASCFFFSFPRFSSPKGRVVFSQTCALMMFDLPCFFPSRGFGVNTKTHFSGHSETGRVRGPGLFRPRCVLFFSSSSARSEL